MMHVPAVDRNAESVGVARPWQLRVDCSERNAALLDLARGCGEFDIRMERLAVGDYLIDGVLRMKLTSQMAPAIRSSAGKMELIFPILFTNNKSRIVQEYSW